MLIHCDVEHTSLTNQRIFFTKSIQIMEYFVDIIEIYFEWLTNKYIE